jgi:hypothetical protein
MPTPKITINFEDTNLGGAEYNIYKSSDSIDTSAPGTPVATIVEAPFSFEDTDVSIGDFSNYYTIEAVSNNISSFGSEVFIILTWYTDTYTYFETNDYTERVLDIS